MRLSKGFTIVELLIVIVVIAILAAITIVAFNGVQQSAVRSAVNSELSQVVKQLEVLKIESGVEQYPTSLPASLIAGIDATLDYTALPAADGYCVQATKEDASYYAVGGESGLKEGVCRIVENMLNNPGAENNASGWTENGGRYGARSTAEARSGNASFLAYNNFTSASVMHYRMTNTSQMTVTPGQTYTASAYVKDYNGTGATHLRIQWLNSSSGSLGTVQSDSLQPSSEWQRLAISREAPASAAFVRLWVTTPSAPVDAGVYVDDVMFTQTDAVTGYADGDSPSWVWTASQGNSTSQGPAL